MPAGWDAAAVPAGWGGGPVREEPPRPGVVPLRPLGLGELLDGSVRIIRGYPGAVLGASAVVAVIGTLLQIVLVLTLSGSVGTVDPAALEAGDTDALIAVQALGLAQGLTATLLALVTGALLAGALSAAAGKAVLGRPFALPDLVDALRGKVLRLVGASLAVLVIVVAPVVLAVALTVVLALVTGGPGGLAGVLLVPAGVVLSVLAFGRLTLVGSALVLEDASVGTALRRSSALVKGSFWRVVGVVLLTLVIALFASSVLQAPFLLFGGGSLTDQVLGGDAPTTGFLLLSSIGGGVASFLVDPFVAGVTALLYVDRRMRAEGLDVALRASSAEAGRGEGAPGA